MSRTVFGLVVADRVGDDESEFPTMGVVRYPSEEAFDGMWRSEAYSVIAQLRYAATT
jgi:hypothetical protein